MKFIENAKWSDEIFLTLYIYILNIRKAILSTPTIVNNTPLPLAMDHVNRRSYFSSCDHSYLYLFVLLRAVLPFSHLPRLPPQFFVFH